MSSQIRRIGQQIDAKQMVALSRTKPLFFCASARQTFYSSFIALRVFAEACRTFSKNECIQRSMQNMMLMTAHCLIKIWSGLENTSIFK